jgi:hypothetical protein
MGPNATTAGGRRGRCTARRIVDFQVGIPDVREAAPAILLETAMQQAPNAFRRVRRQA